MLQAARLLEVVLPEIVELVPDEPWSPESLADTPWRRTLHILHKLQQPTFAVALAVLLRELPAELPRRVYERWKLKNEELEGVVRCRNDESVIRRASQTPWPRLQRVLVAPRCEELLAYCQAVAEALDGGATEIDFCRQKLALPPAELNPPPLITGDDLKQLGIPAGPAYREILERIRDEQLNQRIATREEAILMAREFSA
jgi:poly(A) polymerase